MEDQSTNRALLLKILFPIMFSLFLISCAVESNIGSTEITKWKDGKGGAISLTFDDGSPNQFRNALPILNRLELPATFYVVTGEIEGSKNRPKFIGRPVEEIIQETENVPTGEENFYERASAVAYLGFKETWEHHLQAGSLYEQGRSEEAYEVIDEIYAKARAGELAPGRDISREAGESAQHSWDDYREFAAQGHEFGSHTITHPRLALLDEENMLYELEGSREEVREQLGQAHTFTAEAPFGTVNERVMEYLLDIYPATRNLMPHSWLTEIHRWDDTAPGSSDREYVQWQRGPLTDVPLDTMKSWVDTIFVQDNTWLVLVFHGVDGIGWEPRTSDDLQTYFEYIKEREDDLWVGTFKDVSKYIRQRLNAEVDHFIENDKIVITLTQTLDPNMYLESERYDLDLTLKTYVPEGWETVTIRQGDRTQIVEVNNDETGQFVIYDTTPNAEPVELLEGDSGR